MSYYERDYVVRKTPAQEIAHAASVARDLGLRNKFGYLVEVKRTDKRPSLPKLGSSLRPHCHKKVT